MKIDVKKITQLSNLELSEKEEQEFEIQLEEILDYIGKLNEIDTSRIEPTAQITGLSNVVRNDKFSHKSLSQNEAISGAANTHKEQFVVKKLVNTNQ